ncbi:hypothetical protein [Actinocrispum wychmicini]|uniref:Uncharacterized protein n=1 Tax=Actinocrispum wychmicini TaxID=1213861 RepID=A0A4R2JDY3_9PSEU|nr:hypothetical protein [Actinocrispum wychmicini]TCO57164.1 hypothetical protein EV192_106641 [Actinocrispum wychmicini]
MTTTDGTMTIGTPTDGGWRIKTNDAGTHYVDILAMIYNYRIVLTPIAAPLLIDRFWCYAGHDLQTLLRTFLAAHAWDGALDGEPLDWNKNGQTGEWREP